MVVRAVEKIRTHAVRDRYLRSLREREADLRRAARGAVRRVGEEVEVRVERVLVRELSTRDVHDYHREAHLVNG